MVCMLCRGVDDSGLIMLEPEAPARDAQQAASQHRDDPLRLSAEFHGHHQDGQHDAHANAAPSRGRAAASRPRLYRVRYPRVMLALEWLMTHNPLYEGVRVSLRDAPDPDFLLAMEDAANGVGYDEALLQDAQDWLDLHHSTMLEADPQLPRNPLAHAMQRNQRDPPPRYTLRRLEGPPVSVHLTEAIEALAFPRLYATGANHMKSDRQLDIGMGMYFRQRIMNADRRFQDPLYMSFALSTFHHLQMCDCVDVAIRQTSGPMTLGQLRLAAAEETREVGETAWAFMRNIREQQPTLGKCQQGFVLNDSVPWASYMVHDLQC